MPAKLALPTVQIFPLRKTDEALGCTGEPTTVTFVQASQGAVRERNQFFAEFTQKVGKDGAVETKQRIAPDEVHRKEVFLTMKDCNFQNELGQPYFRFLNGKLASEKEFNDAWDNLLPEVAEEISECCLKVNIQWTAQGNA